MNRLILVIGLAGALAAPALLAPDKASASCADRKLTGTVLGGVGGALIGNSISRGGGGALVGGLGGAVVGHEIAGSGCGRSRASGYSRSSSRSRSAYQYGRAGEPRAVRYVYYDQYGDPVAEGPAPGASSYTPTAYAYTRTPDCSTEMQAYYDDRGALVQRPTQVCAR